MNNKNLQEEIKEIVSKYEMTGAYIDGAKRVEYKHYDTVAKQNMVREIVEQIQTLKQTHAEEVLDGFDRWLGKQGDKDTKIVMTFIRMMLRQYTMSDEFVEIETYKQTLGDKE